MKWEASPRGVGLDKIKRRTGATWCYTGRPQAVMVKGLPHFQEVGLASGEMGVFHQRFGLGYVDKEMVLQLELRWEKTGRVRGSLTWGSGC